ncbi:hypothetical protein ACOMHN_030258 [Nucella lapillus]
MRDELRARLGEAASTSGAAAGALGSILLNAVLVGVSLYDIVHGSLQLHRHTGSRAGDYLRQLARALDDFARTGVIRGTLHFPYLTEDEGVSSLAD